LYLSDTIYLVANVKLSFQLRATLTIVLVLSPQSASQKPCTRPTEGWWKKVYSIDTKSIGTELKNIVYSSSIKGSPSHDSYSQEGKTQGQAKIQELSEIIHEQNFLLQHNDQYMLELENQLEAIVVPPLEPVIPGTAEEEDAEDIQGESGIESP
jgi:hypothetical protein